MPITFRVDNVDLVPITDWSLRVNSDDSQANLSVSDMPTVTLSAGESVKRLYFREGEMHIELNGGASFHFRVASLRIVSCFTRMEVGYPDVRECEINITGRAIGSPNELDNESSNLLSSLLDAVETVMNDPSRIEGYRK